MTLTQASQTNAGVKVRTPDAFRFWLRTALALRPVGDWFTEMVIPRDAQDSRNWKGIRTEGMPARARDIPVGSHPYVRIRSGALVSGKRPPCALMGRMRAFRMPPRGNRPEHQP